MRNTWPLPEQFRVRLTMDSDWHVGSGMGRPGNIDRLITRDADGLPFVPAKTLRGIWRDACERLCRGLDEGQRGDWSKLVDHLFGSQPSLGANDPTGRHRDPAAAPVVSAVQIRAARIPSRLRERLACADVRLRQALTFVKPGVKIDRRSGSAQTDFLRFEEVARKGTILEAVCQLAVSDPSTRELASALLIASAKLVERLGGKRRRGPGRCRLEILDANTEAALSWLDKQQGAPDWTLRQPAQTKSHHPIDSSPNDDWIVVPLRLKLLSPLLASYRTVGNLIETLDYLPGTALLPHISQVMSEFFSPLEPIRRGELLVLNATIEIADQRGLPAPAAWLRPKMNTGLHGCINRFVQPEQDGVQYKAVRELFVSGNEPSNVAWKKVEKTTRTHNIVRDDLQRPDEQVGGVYTYEAINSGSTTESIVFRSEVRLRQFLVKHLPDGWWTKLSARIALGRSSHDDYGDVELEAKEPQQFTVVTSTRSESTLFVWLLSDCLLRNDRLQFDPRPEALAQELSLRLGCELVLRDGTTGLSLMARTSRVESWHGKWQLPRPTLVGLQAGSCFVFQVKSGSLDANRLQQLEASGIGHRTAEGYGQVRFNHPWITAPLMISDNRATSDGEPPPFGNAVITANDSAFTFARLLERECWKQEIRRKCLELSAKSDNRKKFLGWVATGEQGRPPMSQLGGLRGQLAMLRTADDRQQVIGWLNHLADNSRRKDKWPSIPMVKAFIDSDTRIWEIINTDGWPTLTTNAQTELRRDLWALAVRTFFDACIRAHKREFEKQQNHEGVNHGA